MKFELFKGANDEFYFRLKNEDAVWLKSEGYTTKAACENGMASVKKNGTDAARYELKEAANGKWMFNIKATNGQVVATSNLMNSKASAEEVIDTLQKGLASADVEDML